MKKIGLALGGGAVLGAAHIGVLRAIEELEIPVEYIAGTSIGAVVGALYAFGKDWKTIQSIAIDMEWLDIARISLSRYGLISNEKLGDIIKTEIGDKNIQDAHIPLAIVATDITSGKKVVLDKGSLIDAVMASACIPGIFIPIERDGKSLVDGGIVENVPITTAQDLGAEYVIGVDLNAKQSYGKPKNILDVILNSFHFMMKETVKLQTADADMMIRPDLSAFSMTDDGQVEALAEKGYQETQKILQDITREHTENLQKSRITLTNQIIMDKAQFKEKANQQIDEVFAKINELKAKKDNVSDDVKSKYDETINELEAKKSEMQTKLENAKNATEENWEEAKNDFSQAYDAFNEGVSKLTASVF